MTVSIPTPFECLAGMTPTSKAVTSTFGTFSQQRALDDPGDFSLKFQVTDAEKNVITGYEWRIYEDDPTPGILGTVELAGEESATSDSQEYKYYTSGTLTIVLQIMHPNYEENIIILDLTGEPITMLVIMVPEEDF